MKCQRHEHHPRFVQFARIFRLWRLALPACLLMVAPSASAQQEEGQEPPLVEARAAQEVPDALLQKITAAVQGVTTTDTVALSKALHIGERSQTTAPGAPPNTLAPLGDLDGDGVPEMLLKWAIPDVLVGAEPAPASDSSPLWGVYLLSWDGGRWKVSRLLFSVEDFSSTIINLGPLTRRGMAVVVKDGDAHIPYPMMFQVKDHMATLLWDGRADDSRYEPLLQGRVEFIDHPDAPAEMIVTGRGDPGLLQVEPKGHRGFNARAVYHWDGKTFVPVKTVYSPNEDYTVYRFISALHLHDYRSAYGLVAPEKFLNADSPTLDAFRQFIENNWRSFSTTECLRRLNRPLVRRMSTSLCYPSRGSGMFITRSFRMMASPC
jgi:hypothetical protein